MKCKHCGHEIKQDAYGDWYDPEAAQPWDDDCTAYDGEHVPPNDICPMTGRSAGTCDTPDHRNCPDLRDETERPSTKRFSSRYPERMAIIPSQFEDQDPEE